MKKLLITIFCFLYSSNVYASDMAGMALALINLEVTVLIIISIIIAIFSSRKKACAFIYFVDAIVALQADDVDLLNIFILQFLVLLFITIFLKRRLTTNKPEQALLDED